MITSALFYLFAGFAIACAISLVYHKNPLYSAISLIGVFIALSCIYVTLAAPFIAAVQILIYAGAIMVLVIFVIMLLNLDEEKPYRRLNYLYALVSHVVFIGKICAFLFFYIWVRGTLPRFRFDQLMNFGWKFLLPVALINVIATIVVVYFLNV